MQITEWSKATFTVRRDRTRPAAETVKGRVRWALESRILAVPKGCTPMLNPAHRWAVYTPRGAGVAVDTLTELHAAVFAGTHARYVLRDLMELLV